MILLLTTIGLKRYIGLYTARFSDSELEVGDADI